jgi:hypothetical protein
VNPIQPFRVIDNQRHGLIGERRTQHFAERAPGRRLRRRATRPWEAVSPFGDPLGNPRERTGRRRGNTRTHEQTAAGQPQEGAPRRGEIALHCPNHRGTRSLEPRPRGDLIEESRLPDSGVTRDHRGSGAAGGTTPLPRRPDPFQVVSSANERRPARGRIRRPRAHATPLALAPYTIGERCGLRVGRGAELRGDARGESIVLLQRAGTVTVQRQCTHHGPSGCPGQRIDSERSASRRRRLMDVPAAQLGLGKAHQGVHRAPTPGKPLDGKPILERRRARHREPSRNAPATSAAAARQSCAA